MSSRGRVVVLGDHALHASLEGRGYNLRLARTSRLFRHLRGAEVLLTPSHLEDVDAEEVCRFVSKEVKKLPVLALVAPDDRQLADRFVRAGGFAVVPTPVDPEVLRRMMKRAVEHSRLLRKVERLELAIDANLSYDDLLGGSPSMQELYELIDRAAQSDAPVLITGESGTGKEVVALALHRRRSREAPFVPVNLAAVPDTLLESELFGHEKGAFTDARTARRGLFLEAGSGTVFLDEVGELALSMQPKLLRALQSRRVRPLGGTGEQPFNARIVAATNRDLETLVSEGLFREDLFYRLNVIQIDLPPLRSRGGDILLLARHFLERVSTRLAKPVPALSNAAAKRLLAYSWPGNVRELENCMERAVALARSARVEVDDLPRRIRDFKAEHVVVAATDPDELVPMHVVEKRYILRVLKAVGENRTLAARILGFDRKTLYRKLKTYGLDQTD